MQKGFWQNIQWPLIGLAPMDGVTDAAFRYITAKYGKPQLIFTEFTSVEGIQAGALRLLDDFLFSPLEKPILAQLFGADPRAFFKAAVIVSALGFDGIDINMGCPAKNVTSHGAGAALILDPLRAQEIIRQTRAGTEAWANGLSLTELGVPDDMLAAITERQANLNFSSPRQALPISVKTRLGFDKIIITDWVQYLLEVEPVTISLHGRTLKQLYTGEADWSAIAAGAAVIKKTPTKVLGNGDCKSKADAEQKIVQYGVDGVLIGRASFGNPWLFQTKTPSFEERLKVTLEHARYFDQHFPPQAYVRMRKHLLDYIKGEEGAKELRIKLMRVNSLAETEAILLPLLEA